MKNRGSARAVGPTAAPLAGADTRRVPVVAAVVRFFHIVQFSRHKLLVAARTNLVHGGKSATPVGFFVSFMPKRLCRANINNQRPMFRKMGIAAAHLETVVVAERGA